MANRLKGRTVSEQIRAAIDASDQSRYAIARATGIDQAHLSRFMTGERALSQDSIDRLCGHLGLSLTSNLARRNSTRAGAKRKAGE